MSQRQKTTTYTCKYKLSITDKYVEFGRFPSGLGDNCEISFSARKKYNSAYQDILIKKTLKIPTKVDMKLTIWQGQVGHVVEKTKSLDDWQESCYFLDGGIDGCVSRLVSLLFTITLGITWTIPDSPSPHTGLMPYLGLSDFSMSSILSDVTILIGDEKIPTHKLILGAASPVLLSMLTSPMKEAEENCIVIKDIEVDVIKAVLKFLYTGKDEDFHGFEMASKALIVAEKYDMKKFKALCEQKLLKNLSVDNALQILDHADTYEAESLKRESMKFVIDNRNEIIDTQYFDIIYVQKPLLMKEFTMGVINATKELLLIDRPISPVQEAFVDSW